MKRHKYTGTFIAQDNGHKYELTVNCNGFIQAVILLTADAMRSGKHWQLSRVEGEDGTVKQIGDILKIGEIIN